MKVYIGPPRNYFGPYQLAELICFWVKKKPNEDGFLEKPDWVHSFGEFLAHGSVLPEDHDDKYSLSDRRKKTWLYRFLIWLHQKTKDKIKVRIDDYDTWSADHTLSHIILPLLKAVKERKHGSPFVDAEDVPVELRPTKKQINAYNKTGDPDPFFHARWEYVLDEMIWAFEQKVADDWEDQFVSGVQDYSLARVDDKYSRLVEGPNHTYKIDHEKMKQHQNRISNGFRLFGKYYEALWT